MIKKPVVLIIILVSLLFPVQLFAGGNPEVGLPKVDRLIKERNYNAAILVLADYMHENPEDFDGAQRRVRKIINMRESYNGKALDLLLVLANEPTNDQKKLDMIAYLESLEKNPNHSTQEFIVQTKSAAQFTYYRAKFDEILTDGDKLIDSGHYVEAARKFTEGYVLYKQEFDDNTDEQALSKVNSTLGGITASIGSWSLIQSTLESAVAACEAAIASGDIAASEQTASVLELELANLARYRNQIAGNGWFFEDSFNAMQKTGESITENSFLPFAWRFTLGRKTAGRFEGVLGAIDAQWNSVMDRIEKATDTAIRNRWTEGSSSISSGLFETGLTSLKSANRFTAFGSKFVQSAPLFTNWPDTFGIRDLKADSARYVRLGTLISLLSDLGDTYETYAGLKARKDQYSASSATASDIRKTPSDSVKAWNGFLGELDALSFRIKKFSAVVAALPVIPGYSDEFNAMENTLASSIADDVLGVYRSSAVFQQQSSALVLEEWKKTFAEGVQLLEGVHSEDSAQVYYYPVESLADFTKLRTGITADKKSIISAVDTLEKAPDYAKSDEAYAASILDMQKTVAELDALYSNAAEKITIANSRILQANLARQESDLRYAQALASLKKSDFQSARDNLQRSREKINVSLSYEESPELRADSDRKLGQLGADITRIENESVVREVRAFISAGRNFYYLGNFDQSEQLFIQAKTRWSATNIEPNAEVANWLDILNTALSMKTGRTIPVSAPLYPQMSQILSSANQLYSEGKALLEAGKRAEGVAVLTTSKEKLQQLQLVYPLNQDAGQLTLRIDQLIDPEAFRLFFSQKVESIRENYRTARQTAYSDLLDLYQINPSYPGLKKLVDEVEIYLGIKIPPPDPAALARSDELTRSARKLYDANTRSMFQVALDQLDEAIKLNPDNQTALALKDRVQTAVGGQSVAVLSAEDEAKYQQAVQELQKGNKITASALVEQLLQNAKSRNSAKIQDLKQRIDSQL